MPTRSLARLSLPALALAVSAFAAPALAQPVPAGPLPDRAADGAAAATPGQTVLRLSETGEVTRAPDELRLDLRAEARGNAAAAVQAQVNRAVQAALERARAVEGVRPTTTGYWTDREGTGNRTWVASQRIALRGTAPAALLDLAGTLQSQGLLLDGMTWTVSRAETQAARQEAGRMAIEQLRQRAAAVADQLGMEVAAIRSLSLDAPEQPMPRMAMAMRAPAAPAAPPPPASAPEEVTISTTATAEVVLRAK